MTDVRTLAPDGRLSESVEHAAPGDEFAVAHEGPVSTPDAAAPSQDTRDAQLPLTAHIRRTRVGQALGDGVAIRDLIEEGRS